MREGEIGKGGEEKGESDRRENTKLHHKEKGHTSCAAPLWARL